MQAATASNSDVYVQQYDARGYPTNPESDARQDRLVRTENQVLAGMGFVDDSKEKMSLKERIDLVVRENEAGQWVGFGDTTALFLGTWWITSLRRRVEVRLCSLVNAN